MQNHKSDHLVWLITGTSQGFGKELVQAALARGDFVVATSRTPDKVLQDFSGAKDRLLTPSLDLRDPAQINSVVEQAISRFGRIDVLVNNAGYGLLGAIEEVSDEEIAAIYEINVFGLLRITRAVLPYLRKQHSGRIVNISSIIGLVGSAGAGLYSSTKFAIAGLSESLALEVAPLGIHVTIVEPGPFRTDFLGNSLVITDKAIPAYEKSAGCMRTYAVENHKKQAGDPTLGAKAIIQAVLSEKPPLHLLLGAAACKKAHEKLEALHTDFATWQDLSLSCDFKPTPVENE
ncbi:MAG: SDR family NAD(P)-dependent oxidoreductase [Simkania sp.]|nr:SDR family NAD(P)-dependent oxidoreductase [Simkania sp.]